MGHARGGDVQVVFEARIGELHTRALEHLPLRLVGRHRTSSVKAKWGGREVCLEDGVYASQTP